MIQEAKFTQLYIKGSKNNNNVQAGSFSIVGQLEEWAKMDWQKQEESKTTRDRMVVK